MTKTLSTTTHFENDEHFNLLYPWSIRQHSERHWTPFGIALIAAGFLAEQPGSRILDIGSGIGKFCLIGGQHYPGSHFFGVEQRRELVRLAENAKQSTAIDNATFIHGNFTQLDLNRFDHFYFYNSFYENLVDEAFHIDESIDHTFSLYEYYTRYLFKALEGKPSGTRLVTYHCFREVVPSEYRLVASFNTFLRCWIKD
jgi:hypothetical protein